MKSLSIAALLLAMIAAPAAAQTNCTLSTQPISAAGSALTGNTAPRIWVVQQCVDDDGQVRTTVSLCELQDDVDPRVPARCSAPAEIGDAVSKQQE